MPGFYLLHVCNAWEERDDGEVVVLVGSYSANMEHVEMMEMPEDAWRCRKSPNAATRTKAKASLGSRLWIYGQHRRPSDLIISEGLRIYGQDYGFMVKIEGFRNSDFWILAFGPRPKA